jgi:hypothetical protein
VDVAVGFFVKFTTQGPRPHLAHGLLLTLLKSVAFRGFRRSENLLEIILLRGRELGWSALAPWTVWSERCCEVSQEGELCFESKAEFLTFAWTSVAGFKILFLLAAILVARRTMTARCIFGELIVTSAQWADGLWWI